MRARVKRFAVFDLDGTLTDTNDVDADCFLAAIAATFGIHDASGDWEEYSDVTDASILTDLVTRARGWPPTGDEQRAFIAEFVNRLAQEERSRFAEIPGARAFIAHLREIGWTVAVATGGWRQSARLKLRYGGIPPDEFPMATSNDAETRVEIVTAAVARAGGEMDGTTPIVLFGDAAWDVRTAARLRLPLIIVAAESVTATLRQRGARTIIENYLDAQLVVRIMEEALETHPS